MKKFNLSDWALEHRSLVWYFMLVFVLAGVFSYLNLGREEDPNFTIKTMVISAQWPGASAEEVARQVTDRIEKKLEELDSLDHLRSQTVAGRTTIFVELVPETKAKNVEPTWVRVRNMIGDIKGEFPRASWARSSTTVSAMSMAISTPSPAMVSASGNCAIWWKMHARRF